MRSYEKKMSKIGVEPYPISEDKMRGFIMYLKERQTKPALLNTIKLHVAAFVDYFGQQDERDLTKNPKFKKFMRATRLEMGEAAPNARDPIGPDILTGLAAYVVQASLPELVVTFSMISMMYYGFLRFSEAANLQYREIVEDEDGMTLTIRQSKTDAFGKGAICFIQKSDTPYCACHWFRQAREVMSDVSASARVFPISLQKFNQDLRSLLTAAGFDEGNYSSHSMRRGGAQQAARMQVEDNVIQRHGRWKSTAFLIYTSMERKAAGRMITSRI
jgi:integrase